MGGFFPCLVYTRAGQEILRVYTYRNESSGLAIQPNATPLLDYFMFSLYSCEPGVVVGCLDHVCFYLVE